MIAAIVAFALPTSSAHADEEQAPPAAPSRIEVAVGASALVYQSFFFGSAELAVDASARGPIHGVWMWGAGARLGVPSVRPEAFGRFLAAPVFGAWNPWAGVELGVSTRARFGASALLGDARQAADHDPGPFYVALDAAPLGFRLGERWRLSMLELQLGTQLSPYGRYDRYQIELLTFGAAL